MQVARLTFVPGFDFNIVVAEPAIMTASMKWPPKLEDETDYESWKDDVQMWCDLTDIVEEKQAIAIHLSLTGAAHKATGQLGRDKLKKSNGVKILLEKLDSLYLVDKGRRQFAAFNELYNLRRSSGTDINSFVAEFEQVYYKFTQQDMTLPDPVMAFMLLASCELDENDRRMVMTAVTDVSFENMKFALKRIFCNNIAPKVDVGPFGVQVKTEPVYYGRKEDKNQPDVDGGHTAESEQEVMYSSSNRRGRGSWRGGRGVRLTGGNRQPVSRGGRQGNPVGRDGRVTTCFRCGSRYHWAQRCPEPKETTAEESEREENEETVHLSLFMGYTNSDKRNRKLESLIEQSNGYAVLDTGCSATVCGAGWLENYLNGLTDYERSKLVEESSDSKFTFGIGATVTSLKKITIPCYLGKIKCSITTDVVDCEVPLLLSKRSMKKVKMLLDFDQDTVTVHGEVLQLKSSTSGHYLLPLSL